MFVVEVCHDTGHGLVSNVVLITSRPALALITVRAEKELGYEFLSEDAYLSLSWISPEQIYKKSTFKQTNPLILVRRLQAEEHGGVTIGESHWTEEWVNLKLKERFNLA